MFPALSSLLDAVLESFSLTHASQRNISAVLELALSALKCDPVSCPLLETLQVQQHSALVSLHKAASATVAQIFLLFPAQRKGVLAELLGMLNLSYSVKVPYRDYPLQNAMGGGQDSGASQCVYTNASFATLVLSIQGVVSLEDCIPEQDIHVSTVAPVKPHTSTKNKGKRGKKSMNDNETEPSEGDSALDTVTTVSSESTKERARKGLFPVYSCSAMFVSELFQVISTILILLHI